MSKANRDKRTSVRANTAKYTPEKPLFGKYVGSVYRPEHERGVPESSTTVESMSNQIQDDALAGKMFSIDEYGYANEVVCPYCGFNYVHFTKARQISGEDKYKASEMYDIGVRGDVIVIPFWCEEGHEWVLVLGGHKGNIFHKTVLLDEEQKGREKNIMTTSQTKQIEGLNVTLELHPREVELLMRAIVTRQIEIVDFLPEGVPQEYAELQSLLAEMRGQLKMLDLVNKQMNG